MVEPESSGLRVRLGGTTMRVLSSVAMIPAVLLCVYWGGWPFAILICIAGLAMVYEWARMIEGPTRLSAFYGLAVATSLAVIAAGFQQFNSAILIAAVGGIATYLLARTEGAKRFWSGFGAFYLIIPCVALIWLRAMPDGGRLLTFMLFVAVWATDIGAFFVGRLIGGPKLNPAISPKKTWAGTVGGVVAGAVGFTAVGVWFFGPASALGFLGAGCGLAIASVIGDMVESAMKRGFGVKDSGTLIPGHGGVLDRLDGMIFATVALSLTLYIYSLAG